MKFNNIIVFLFLLSTSICKSQTLFIDHPDALEKLTESGFDLPRLVFEEKSQASSNRELLGNKAYRNIVEDISKELSSYKENDPKLFISMRGSHRLFDQQWLISDYSRFELVGMINRMDRFPFSHGSCGEIRAIYRLSYKTLKPPIVYSRLPMTINAVFNVDASDTSCKKPAQKWTEFVKKVEAKKWHEIAKEALPITSLKDFEVNLQAVRWPSTIRPDMGGYAEYLLRVYQIDSNKAIRMPLENMIDVKKLSANFKLKQELKKWIQDSNHLQRIDLGVAILPAKFLADTATSVALHGQHRLANSPYTQIFSEDDFKNLSLAKYRTIKSPKGLLKRLNDLSCVGCHQGRTVAGFHFLGEDKKETDAINSIRVSASPHFKLDQNRRTKFFTALLNGTTPDSFRAISVRAESGEGKTGSHCGLGDPSFTEWTCGTGFKCVNSVEDKKVNSTGICVAEEKLSGNPCQFGKMIHSSNPKRDSLKSMPSPSCGTEYHCEVSTVGFPNGMCSKGCFDLKPGEICGSIADLAGFNGCLAKEKSNFVSCLTNNVRPGALQECSDETFCRDDYICSRSTDQKGVCLPPYFLFQLRVDGHPSPGLAKESFTATDWLRKFLPD